MVQSHGIRDSMIPTITVLEWRKITQRGVGYARKTKAIAGLCCDMACTGDKQSEYPTSHKSVDKPVHIHSHVAYLRIANFQRIHHQTSEIGLRQNPIQTSSRVLPNCFKRERKHT